MDQNIAPVPMPSTAGDVMTTAIVSVLPETSLRQVADVMLKSGVDTVPVVDTAGALIGIASDNELLGLQGEGRLPRQPWWLAILSKPGQLDAAVTEAASARPVREVMHAPVVTIAEGTSVQEAAELLRTCGIKLLPVMRGGTLVGVVTGADLLRVVEAIPASPPSARSHGGFADMLGSFFDGAGSGGAGKPVPATSAASRPALPTADTFRHLVKASDQAKVDEKKAIAHAAELDRLQQVKTMLQDHVGGQMWATLFTHARLAAANGQREMQLLRFPADLCTDDARKINNSDPAWAETLRGEAAEVYARWDCELKPAGFGLQARVLDYPNGTPGDVALFLLWQD